MVPAHVGIKWATAIEQYSKSGGILKFTSHPGDTVFGAPDLDLEEKGIP